MENRLRLFFALPISGKVAHQIEQWRRAQWCNGRLQEARAVPSGNYHITLYYLGQLGARSLPALIESANQLHLPSFNLTLNQTGSFQKSRVAIY